jgi:hypothetical protein
MHQENAAPNRIPPLRLPFFLIVLLACFSLLPWVRANLRLAASFWGASAVLALFLLLLRRRVARTGRTLRYAIAPKPVHCVQLAMTNREALAKERFQQACEVSSRFTESSAAYFKPGTAPQSGTASRFCSEVNR